jgi:tRNA-Thr(GGU) m(6)t(6)A37 methyltransferase TsaA
MEIFLKPIGFIYTPFENRNETPPQVHLSKGTKGEIRIFKEYEEGLKDLEKFLHIILIFHLNKINEYKLKLIPGVSNKICGVFSTRSPFRPNHIGLSVVKLLDIHKNTIKIEGIDVLNETPLLDIKPYIPGLDCIKNDT